MAENTFEQFFSKAFISRMRVAASGNFDPSVLPQSELGVAVDLLVMVLHHTSDMTADILRFIDSGGNSKFSTQDCDESILLAALDRIPTLPESVPLSDTEVAEFGKFMIALNFYVYFAALFAQNAAEIIKNIPLFAMDFERIGSHAVRALNTALENVVPEDRESAEMFLAISAASALSLIDDAGSDDDEDEESISGMDDEDDEDDEDEYIIGEDDDEDEYIH